MQNDDKKCESVEIKSDAAADMFAHAAKLTAEPLIFVDVEDIEKK